MRRVAGVTLAVSTFFLVVMAILINSPALFYMSTAIIATLAGSRLQAYLAIRGLRFERSAPSSVTVGETVSIVIMVWSERRIKRPLITIIDELPSRMRVAERTRSLPIAPAFDQPIFTRYRFKVLRRGRYRWSKLAVQGTDALGLVTMQRDYSANSVEMTVYPAPIPVSISFHQTTGWGASELESGKFRGAGIESRGTREYAYGDPLRYVHWPSTARVGRLMVKEFESGAGLNLNIVMQRTAGTEVGAEAYTSFEAMCGHACYVAREFLRKGARVFFPTLEDPENASWAEAVRQDQIDELLALVQADVRESLSEELVQMRSRFGEGSTVFVMMAVQDPNLVATMRSMGDVQFVCLAYDTLDYLSRADNRVPSAADPGYIDELQSCGCQVILMPAVGRGA